MALRIVVASLWFVSSWMTYGLVAYLLGVPDTGGPLFGAVLGVLVFIDPTGQIWNRRRGTDAAPAETAPQGEPAAKAAL
jgi:hypothetical protein